MQKLISSYKLELFFVSIAIISCGVSLFTYLSTTEKQSSCILETKTITVPPVNSIDHTESNSIRINVNTALLGELDTLPGIGEKTAQKIIDNKPYSSVEELRDKKIVANSVYDKIKELISAE
ncbi:MAG: helix-hairpin-helix domain-containing protein, partial [Patescibacteria group bacterium]